jgi:hypothetical protein
MRKLSQCAQLRCPVRSQPLVARDQRKHLALGGVDVGGQRRDPVAERLDLVGVGIGKLGLGGCAIHTTDRRDPRDTLRPVLRPRDLAHGERAIHGTTPHPAERIPRNPPYLETQ